MNNREPIEQARENIWQAVKDYRAHTSEKDILNDITDSFVNRLAEDSVIAKQELRELFQTSPIWDENLNALVINSTRTHNPDYSRIYNLAHEIFKPKKKNFNYSAVEKINKAITFFTKPNDDPTEYIAPIKELAHLKPMLRGRNRAEFLRHFATLSEFQMTMLEVNFRGSTRSLQMN